MYFLLPCLLEIILTGNDDLLNFRQLLTNVVLELSLNIRIQNQYKALLVIHLCSKYDAPAQTLHDTYGDMLNYTLKKLVT